MLYFKKSQSHSKCYAITFQLISETYLQFLTFLKIKKLIAVTSQPYSF